MRTAAKSLMAIVGSVSCLLLTSLPGQALETPYPLTSVLINPTPLDPIIAALPALPTAYTPYAGKVCPSGGNVCIDRVLTEMTKRLGPIAASCSDDAIFSLAYLRVTQNVAAANRTGYFSDPTWLNRLDAEFATMYFHTMDAYQSGRSVPPAWKVALDASRDHTLNGLGNFMISMNAHINNDFSHALVIVGLTSADGTSHKADHNAYNDRLDSLYRPVFTEENSRFDPTFDSYHVGPFEATAAGVIMRGWREMVWRNAELLANAKTTQQKALVDQWISNYALAQAQLIKSMPIFQATPASDAVRNAYCAIHHG